MNKCKCGSYAINDDPNGVLCDKCWRDAKIEKLEHIIFECITHAIDERDWLENALLEVVK